MHICPHFPWKCHTTVYFGLGSKIGFKYQTKLGLAKVYSRKGDTAGFLCTPSPDLLSYVCFDQHSFGVGGMREWNKKQSYRFMYRKVGFGKTRCSDGEAPVPRNFSCLLYPAERGGQFLGMKRRAWISQSPEGVYVGDSFRLQSSGGEALADIFYINWI